VCRKSCTSANAFGQTSELQAHGKSAGDLCHFPMVWVSLVRLMIALMGTKTLRSVLQPPESSRMNDPVAVSLDSIGSGLTGSAKQPPALDHWINQRHGACAPRFQNRKLFYVQFPAYPGQQRNRFPTQSSKSRLTTFNHLTRASGLHTYRPTDFEHVSSGTLTPAGGTMTESRNW